jgi:hypothetical protein
MTDIMFENIKAMILDALSQQDRTIEPEIYVPVIKDGHARISDPEQIQEIYCDISTKEHGEQYLGIHSGVIYIVVPPWELDA